MRGRFSCGFFAEAASPTSSTSRPRCRDATPAKQGHHARLRQCGQEREEENAIEYGHQMNRCKVATCQGYSHSAATCGGVVAFFQAGLSEAWPLARLLAHAHAHTHQRPLLVYISAASVHLDKSWRAHTQCQADVGCRIWGGVGMRLLSALCCIRHIPCCLFVVPGAV